MPTMNEQQADKIIELLTTISERLEQVNDRLVIKREFEGETINFLEETTVAELVEKIEQKG